MLACMHGNCMSSNTQRQAVTALLCVAADQGRLEVELYLIIIVWRKAGLQNCPGCATDYIRSVCYTTIEGPDRSRSFHGREGTGSERSRPKPGCRSVDSFSTVGSKRLYANA
nr:hypothetical protein CFP56_66113 [Quercus suber]